MLQLVAWLVVCFAVAWLTRHRPLVAVSLALLLWSLVPAVAAHRLTGQTTGVTDVHPASLLVVVVAVVSFLLRPRTMAASLSTHPFATLALGLFLGVVTATYVLVGGEGFPIVVDQVVAPVLLFWVAVGSASADPRGVVLLRNTIVGAVSLQCLLAVVELALQDFVLYGPDYAGISWYDPQRFTRWPGTTDHPLVLALAVGVAAPLTAGLRRTWLRVVLLALQVVGILITQSRVGLVVMVVVLLYVLLRGRMSALARILSAALAAVGVSALASSTLASGVLNRISDDGGSAAARGDAYAHFLGRLDEFWFTGEGLGASYTVAREAGLDTSFESSVLMYVADFGLLATAAYFGAMVGLVLAHARDNAVLGASVGALAGLAMAQTFSALAYSNLSGVLLWAALAVVVAGGTPPFTRGTPASSLRAPARRALAGSATRH